MTSAGRLPVAILAGGLATRLGPLAERTPKALLDVNGEPFVAHQLRQLRAAGVDHVVMCVGHLGEMIAAYVGSGERFGLRVDFSFDGPHLRGTAGALRNARGLLDDAFFVLYGDSYLQIDYESVENAFVRANRMALMTVFRNSGRWDRSNVELVDGEVIAYDKKALTPRMQYIDYGLGVLREAALDLVPDTAAYDLADLYRALLVGGQLAAYEAKHRFYEIGSPKGLNELREFLAASSVVR